MIAAFKIQDSFSHQEDYQNLQGNCGLFAAEFSEETCEFFYYLKPSEADRWFFIRTNTKDAEKFVSSAQRFADNLGFEIMPRNETKILLNKINLALFV